MRENGYWICLSVGWNRERLRGTRWDALVISVQPTDEPDEPNPKALAAERPGRIVVWGVWAPMTGWSMVGQEGPPRLVERFATCEFREQAGFRAALRLGIGLALRLALGLAGHDPGPCPPPGVN